MSLHSLPLPASMMSTNYVSLLWVWTWWKLKTMKESLALTDFTLDLGEGRKFNRNAYAKLIMSCSLILHQMVMSVPVIPVKTAASAMRESTDFCANASVVILVHSVRPKALWKPSTGLLVNVMDLATRTAISAAVSKMRDDQILPYKVKTQYVHL